MNTVNIPADTYDATLAWCNERRKEHGIEPPWTELPAGRPGNKMHCPRGQSVPGMVVGFFQYIVNKALIGQGANEAHMFFAEEHGPELPSEVVAFVQHFDAVGVRGHDVLPVRVGK